MLGSCECGNEPLGFTKCGECSFVAEKLLASQEGLCSMELVYSILYDVRNPSLREIFGLKWEVVIGSCRKLHNEELYDP